jgi:hypothetical protein
VELLPLVKPPRSPAGENTSFTCTSYIWYDYVGDLVEVTFLGLSFYFVVFSCLCHVQLVRFYWTLLFNVHSEDPNIRCSLAVPLYERMFNQCSYLDKRRVCISSVFHKVYRPWPSVKYTGQFNKKMINTLVCTCPGLFVKLTQLLLHRFDQLDT